MSSPNTQQPLQRCLLTVEGYLDLGMLAEAEQEIQKLFFFSRIYERDISVLSLRCGIYQRQQRFKDAWKVARTMCEVSPTCLVFWKLQVILLFAYKGPTAAYELICSKTELLTDLEFFVDLMSYLRNLCS